MGSMPRARPPADSDEPRDRLPTGQACAWLLLLLGHLLLAQLTLVLAVAFTVTGRVSRWRVGGGWPGWLWPG